LRPASRSSRNRRGKTASPSAGQALLGENGAPLARPKASALDAAGFLNKPSLIGACVAFGLAIMALGVAGLWWIERRQHWPEVWLPNIAAELGGLAVAVVIVDLFLNALRTRDQQRTLAPEQRAVAGDLADAIRPFVSFIVWSYAASGGDEESAPRDAGDFLMAALHDRIIDSDLLYDHAWVGRLGALLERVAASFREFDAAEYHGVLTPQMISCIQTTYRKAASYGTAIFDAQRTEDPTLAHKITADACATIGVLLASVIRECNRITRAPFTTEASWIVWPVVHSFHKFSTEAEA
jgi:hypothetical protein